MEEYDLIKQLGYNLNYECEEYLIDDFVSSEKHSILFETDTLKLHDHVGAPDPLAVTVADQDWSDDFVKMPFSDSNLTKNDQKQWPEIVKCLTRLAETLIHDPDSIHIEYAIRKINSKFGDKLNFELLHYLFNEEIEGIKGETILKEILPKMVKLAIDMPNKIRAGIPILRANQAHSLSISQEQCACILANAFFCTFPERDIYDNPECMPFFNFNTLFSGTGLPGPQLEKLKCIFNYFRRVTSEMPIGIVTFSRQCLQSNHVPVFDESTKPLRQVLIREEGTIEDCTGAVQMDFANEYIGGGVLGHGCVQEEIRFMICPELLCSLLFCEVMQPNESIVIKGAERFSSYTGYADSFEWSDDYIDETPRDGLKRLYTHVLALDAVLFPRFSLQFDEQNVRRELIKCFCGFRSDSTNSKKAAIATGNWGCGVFGGDIELKFLIQMIAAAEADRDLIYFTFHNNRVSKKLELIKEIIERNNLNVSQVIEIINEYANEIKDLKRHEIKKFGISEFMTTKF